MLTKNIYIIYPAGYSGSYLNWAINISDKDLHSTTVKSPINTSANLQFGGAGTSHYHVRIPTHQGLLSHLSWVIYNRPLEKKIYIINEGTRGVNICIRAIMQSDPTGVFVIIHNNSDPDVDAYGTINCITKWPTFGEASLQLSHTDPREENFSWHESSRAYRNFIVKNLDSFFTHMEKPDYHAIKNEVQKAQNWYLTRNKLQPHEVNESTYVSDFTLEKRLFDISCADIASLRFPHWLENFLNHSEVSNDYDCKYVTDYHSNYINAQNNLKWFESISQWEATGMLDDYLISHCGIEAHVISRIFKNAKGNIERKKEFDWPTFYNQIKDPSWPANVDEQDFYTLPVWIQTEIIQQHGYQNNHNLTNQSTTNILNIDWQTISTEEINQIYQSTLPKKVLA